MRFKIREKIFSFGDDFVIRDELDNPYFTIKGKVFSFGDKLRMYNMNGAEILYIEQQILKFLPEYYIYSQGQQIARVKKKLSFLTPSFDVQSSLGQYTVEGSFLGMDFSIYKNGDWVAQVSKKWFSFSDTYGVEIKDTEDYAFMLALVIVIDQVLHDNRNK